MTLPTMPAAPSRRESLRIAGGFGAPASGMSPAGGLDIDNAGNLATDGDITTAGRITAGSTSKTITTADGSLDGAQLAAGSVGRSQLAASAVDASKLDAAASYTMAGLTMNGGITGAGTGAFRVKATNDALDLDHYHASNQLVRIFAASNPDASQCRLIIYEPGTSTFKHIFYAKTGDLWVSGNVSAASFTDRSPMYTGGQALDVLAAIRPEAGAPAKADWAEVDHATLGPLRVEKQQDGRLRHERDLNKQIQLNTAAILELLGRLRALEPHESA